MPKVSMSDKQESREHLLHLLKPGDTVYTLVKHVAPSGMSRVLSVYVIHNNQPICIDGYVSDLVGSWDGRHGGVKMTGCGMDMGFALVYALSWELFRDGWDCLNNMQNEHKCPCNSHTNDRNAPSGPDVRHNEAGYALRHAWM